MWKKVVCLEMDSVSKAWKSSLSFFFFSENNNLRLMVRNHQQIPLCLRA